MFRSFVSAPGNDTTATRIAVVAEQRITIPFGLARGCRNREGGKKRNCRECLARVACQTESPSRKGAALAGRRVFVAACLGDMSVFRCCLHWRGGGSVLHSCPREAMHGFSGCCCSCGFLFPFFGKTEWWWRFRYYLVVGLPQCDSPTDPSNGLGQPSPRPAMKQRPP